MSELLERAVEKAKTLTESEQDAIASIIMEELEDEGRWDHRFSHSSHQLSRLAEEAVEEDLRGETEKLNPDAL